MSTKNTSEEPEFSIKGLLAVWLAIFSNLLKSWRQIALAAIIGGALGFAYFLIVKPTYNARLTFVVEEAKQSGGGMLSALAGQFGVDIGGMAGTSGVLAGDNVQELLKSRFLIKKVLLSKSPIDSSVSIADSYAKEYGWLKDWTQPVAVGSKNLTRYQDSLLQIMIKRVLEKELSISKPDKKLGFFELNIVNKNELLSQVICQQLIKEATIFYIDTKTRRLKVNVDRLQHKSDSLEFLLNKKTFSTLAQNQDMLNLNPAYTTAGADLEISNRDKIMISSIYSEVVKNLEISKTALIQETPTVQIVDQPELPLKKNEWKWWMAFLVGTFAGIVVICSTLLFSKASS
jgi:hypothetical protein